MQAQRQPTGGLNRLPQVTVPMQEGGMMEEAMMQEEQMPVQPMNLEEQAMMMQQVEQQEPREPNPEIQAMAQQVASYGRGGDKLLLHMRPDELQGLSSMLNITINPTTGMPEVFLNKIFKPIRRIAKSKAFKTIAPIALAIAAPMILPQLSPVFASGGMFAGGTALGAGVQAGLGSLAGNLLAGRKFGDAAKAALITGGTAGIMKGIGNKMAGKSFSGVTKPLPPGAGESVGAPGFQGDFAGPKPTSFSGTSTEIPGLTTTGVDSSGLGTTGNIADMKYGQAAAQTQPNIVQDVINTQQTTGVIDTPLSYGQSLSPDAVSNIADAGSFAKPPVMTGPVAPTEPTFLSKLGDAKDAVVSGLKDRYSGLGSFDKGAIMNLGKDVLTADVGQSALDMEQKQQQALEDQQLQAAGYSVSYPSGFGGQKVIRDSSGVITNLTAAEILQRALGGGKMQFAPKTTYVETKEGGLINLAAGGEFSGMVPGQGGGMDDNVYMPIKEGQKQVGTLAVSPTEYVVDSYTMAALGDGNPNEGAKVMDKTIEQIRKKAYGTTKQPNEIDGLAALQPMAQGV
jgi:hypothetical protein